MKRKYFLIFFLLILVIALIVFFKYLKQQTPNSAENISNIQQASTLNQTNSKIQQKQVYNTTISGVFDENQVWSKEIIVTGDVLILKDLTIMPGTIVKFSVQDDQKKGYEVFADGYNDLDPTRLISYGKNHSSLTVMGKLNAIGTPEKRILFTSLSSEPRIADWEAIYPFGDGSLIEYSVIEYSRNGISPGDNPTYNSIFKNNIIKHTFWGAVSAGGSSSQIYHNKIYECGHEGVDVQAGNPQIENNTIYDCHTGIVILGGNAVIKNNIMKNVGDGIHIEKDAKPELINNSIEIAPSNSKKEWKYGNFAYQMFGDSKLY